MRPLSRCITACALLSLSLLLLSCITLPWQLSEGASSDAVPSVPRWACPTPSPVPFGEAGPVKAREDGQPDPTTGVVEQKTIYYAEWEQEDFDGNGDPFPAPTPFTKTGAGFYLGQLVNLSPSLDVQATAAPTDTQTGTRRLYDITLTWHNRGTPVTLAPARQVVISAVRKPDGFLVAGDGWTVNTDTAAQRPDLMAYTVATGTSTLVVPIMAPAGAVETVDLRLDLQAQASAELGSLRVQWTRADEPLCGEPGTEAATYGDGATALQALPPPAEGGDMVTFAEAQVGRPYCWGAKGFVPCSGCDPINGCITPSCSAQGGTPCWDCSGLTWGAYNAVGVTIGHGTSNQKDYPPVWRAGDAGDPLLLAQPGDLLLFTHLNDVGRPVGAITHVGLYAGNGLMIHAANYPDGVIRSPNVFTNRYYRAALVIITRPPT